MPARLADLLTAVRRELFVGRTAEQALFDSAISAPRLPFNVLHVHGPGGIGKTMLLRAFWRICESEGVSAAWLDARDLEPTPAAFLAALGGALRLDPLPRSLDQFVLGPERRIILLDTYENLTPLDDWLRNDLLPELPEQVLIVLASRQPPRRAWRVDPGWQSVLRVLPLRNLDLEESRRYLARRQVPEEAHATALAFTHGHPLALSLIGDVLRQRSNQSFDPERSPDVIRVLLEQLLDEIPGSLHRTAVEASALLRVTTEDVLAEVLDVEDAHEIFRWLRDLSFMESGLFGLFPHDLARDALSADLRWRHPDRFALLHGRARAYYGRRLRETRGWEQQRVLSDYVYLHRENPFFKPFLDWQDTGTALPEVAIPADFPALIQMVRRHEGDESAALAACWLERKPDSTLLIRDARREPAGFLMMLPLHDVCPDERRQDPAIEAACSYLERNAPLRAGQLATHFRFWMADDAYQSVSAAQSLIFLKIAQHYLTTPALGFTFLPLADAGFWAPFCAYIDLFAAPGADFQVGGRWYRVFGHDWRAVPPSVWLDMLAERELDSSPPAPAAPPRSTDLLLLGEQAFGAAVQDALRSFTRSRELRRNPLLRSRIVKLAAGEGATEPQRTAALQGLLRQASESLRSSPRQGKYADALHHAYFHPAASQEQAARLLYVSFSTFRRHLRAGVDHVAQTLWQWEVEGWTR